MDIDEIKAIIKVSKDATRDSFVKRQLTRLELQITKDSKAYTEMFEHLRTDNIKFKELYAVIDELKSELTKVKEERDSLRCCGNCYYTEEEVGVECFKCIRATKTESSKIRDYWESNK